MTEKEWLEATDPEVMLVFLRDKVSDRKLRLFSSATFAKLESSLPTNHRRGIAILDEFADNPHLRVSSIVAEIRNDTSMIRHPYDFSKYISIIMYTELDFLKIGEYAECAEWGIVKKQNIRMEQIKIIHDIFGNIISPVAIKNAWESSVALSLAQGIYDEKAFDRLPILADALMDAGCDNEEILNHCRGEGPHTRGCWVIDKLLGKL